MQALDDIMNIKTEELKCDNHNQNETIEELDEIITQKWQAAEKAVRDIDQISWFWYELFDVII